MDNDELVEHYDSTCWGNNNARIHKLEKALKKLLED